MPELTKTQLFEIERFLRMIADMDAYQLASKAADLREGAHVYAELIEAAVDAMEGEIQSPDEAEDDHIERLTPEQLERIRRQMEKDRELENE